MTRTFTDNIFITLLARKIIIYDNFIAREITKLSWTLGLCNRSYSILQCHLLMI